MELDIRTAVQTTTAVRFADALTAEEYGQADVLVRNNGEIQIKESNNADYVRLCSKQHALDLIKAIEYAIEKDWFTN